MARLDLRLAANVPGDFYVDSTCIDCDQCRAIAPETFVEVDEMSAVGRQPETPAALFAALQALVTCPTASIGSTVHHSVRAAAASYPERIDGNVYFCGYAAESSFGASSYLIVRPEGNVLVDSPRFAGQLVHGIEAAGGVRWIFLTHRDDVADHEKWARRFGAERILHAADLSRGTQAVERRLQGRDPVSLAPDLLAIPTPGHTAGHAVLLHDERYLFTGDHLWWSPGRKTLVASQSVCWYSWKEQLESVRRLLDHRFEWVLPGHGRRFHAEPETLHAQLEALLARER